MKRNITKQLCECMAVHELLTALLALELALPGGGDSGTHAFDAISI